MAIVARRLAHWRRHRSRMLMAALVMFGVACGTLREPHENFKAIVGGAVGRNINKEQQSSRVISTTALANGHKELEFRLRGTCHYFYEVDAEGTIVGWRFVGTEKDCVIYP